MTIEIDPESAAELRRHARTAFPREACGLLGRVQGSTTTRLTGYRPMANLAVAAHRFAMDPVAVVRAEQALRAAGLELAAVFHSHPRQAAVPSATDQAAAWPGLVQLILAIDSPADHTGELTAWIPNGDGSGSGDGSGDGDLRRIEWRSRRCPA